MEERIENPRGWIEAADQAGDSFMRRAEEARQKAAELREELARELDLDLQLDFH